MVAVRVRQDSVTFLYLPSRTCYSLTCHLRAGAGGGCKGRMALLTTRVQMLFFLECFGFPPYHCCVCPALQAHHKHRCGFFRAPEIAEEKGKPFLPYLLTFLFRITVRGLPPVTARLALLRWRSSSRAPAGARSLARLRPDEQGAARQQGCGRELRPLLVRAPRPCAAAPAGRPLTPPLTACVRPVLCAAVPTTSRAGRAWTSSGRTARTRPPTGR